MTFNPLAAPDGDAETGRDSDARTGTRGGGDRQQRRRAWDENETKYDAHIGHERCRFDQHIVLF
jgi:hypothetical protein